MVRVFSCFGSALHQAVTPPSTMGLAAVGVLAILSFGPPALAAKFFGLGDVSGGNFHSDAYGVSANGSVVVGRGDTPVNFEGDAFRWTSGTGMVALGDLPGGDPNSYALGVS